MARSMVVHKQGREVLNNHFHLVVITIQYIWHRCHDRCHDRGELIRSRVNLDRGPCQKPKKHIPGGLDAECQPGKDMQTETTSASLPIISQVNSASHGSDEPMLLHIRRAYGPVFSLRTVYPHVLCTA